MTGVICKHGVLGAPLGSGCAACAKESGRVLLDAFVPPASAPAATAGEPLNISDEERARLPKLGVPDDTMARGISHPPLRPEVQAELDAFREHLTWHREDSAPDCRFCTERDAKKRPAAPTGEEAETPERIIAAAREEIRALCNGDKRWRMCVPVESTDSDEVFGRLANLAEAQATTLAALRARVEGYREAYAKAVGYHLISEEATFRPDAASYVKPSELDGIVEDICRAFARARAALAPRQTTGDQP